MNLKVVRWNGWTRFHSSQDKNQWLGFLNTGMKFGFPLKAGIFFDYLSGYFRLKKNFVSCSLFVNL
jgi:hypothetical protein